MFVLLASGALSVLLASGPNRRSTALPRSRLSPSSQLRWGGSCPLLGISLVGFLVVDAVIAGAGARRASPDLSAAGPTLSMPGKGDEQKGWAEMRFVHTADWQLGMTRHFLDGEAQPRYSAARRDAVAGLGRWPARPGRSSSWSPATSSSTTNWPRR